MALLKELTIDGKGSYGIGASAVEKRDDLYTYLRITDIRDDGTLNLADLKSVSDPDAPNYLLSPNDIVFARTGASTGRNYFYDGSDGEFVYAGFLIKFSIDPQMVNPLYIKYYCQSVQYRNWIKSFSTGSTRGNINAQTLGNMYIPLPSREQQDFLVNTLVPIDAKIKLNNQINDNLEQQLHMLYTKLFAKSTMDTVLGDVVKTTSGGTPSRKHGEYYDHGNICWVKSKELLGGYLLDTEEHINELAVSKSSAKLLPSHSVLIAMYGATVGAYSIISKPMTCNQAVCALLSNENYPYTYLFQVACESQQQLINLAVGSAQQNISQVLIKQLPIHSNKGDIQEFHSLAQPIHKRMEALNAENILLTDTRDTLLPKFMSGELDVSKLDI
jgi:type I restriction enzyme S subunit